MDFKEKIVEILKKLTKQKEISIETPPDSSMGDFAFPCFSLAKVYKKNPVEIAKELAAKIKSKGEIGVYIYFHDLNNYYNFKWEEINRNWIYKIIKLIRIFLNHKNFKITDPPPIHKKIENNNISIILSIYERILGLLAHKKLKGKLFPGFYIIIGRKIS